MKRLLIFHPYLAPYRIDLYNKLNSVAKLKVMLLGSEAEIATLGYDLDKVNEQANFDFEYHKKGLRIGRHLLSNLYYKTIKAFKPDVVLAHELGVNTLAAIACKKTCNSEVFITIDDSPSMVMNYGRKREWLRRFILKRIDGAIVVNPQVKEYLEKKYKDYACKYHYFPIIQNDKALSSKIDGSKHKAEEYVEQFGLYGKKVILFVGRLEKMKAPDMLVEVFAQLHDENSILVVVGKGSMQEKIVEYVKGNQLGQKIILTGSLSGNDLYAWYYLAHVFVLPSNHEPFGAVVNEALVAGCYTIVSDRVGANALIDDKNGMIVPHNDRQALAEGIKNALQDVPVKKEHDSMMPKDFDAFFNDLIRFLHL